MSKDFANGILKQLGPGDETQGGRLRGACLLQHRKRKIAEKENKMNRRTFLKTLPALSVLAGSAAA